MRNTIETVNLVEVGAEFKRIRLSKKKHLSDVADAMGISVAATHKKEEHLKYRDLVHICERMGWEPPRPISRILGFVEIKELDHPQLGQVLAVPSPTKEHVMFVEMFNGDIARVHAQTGVLLNVLKPAQADE